MIRMRQQTGSAMDGILFLSMAHKQQATTTAGSGRLSR